MHSFWILCAVIASWLLASIQEAEARKNKVNHAIRIQALNRPFKLGMLYDVRHDLLIPGVTLWDSEDIDNDTTTEIFRSQSHSITTTHNFHEKAFLLDIEAELRLSLMGGLIKIKGSAGYLNEMSSTRLKERVTVKYESQTKYEQLNMGTLAKDNIKYIDVLDNKEATHVVTAIQYGARVIFTFEKEESDYLDNKEMKGSLHVIINKGVSIEGDASLELDDKDKEVLKTLKFTFNSDIVLDPNPTSFSEAIELYKKLGPLIGEGIPTIVYLTPLEQLDSNAAKLSREINLNMELKIEEIYEGFQDILMRCDDLINHGIFQLFSSYNRMKKFQSLVDRRKQYFENDLSDILPRIRSGKGKPEELGNLTIHHMESPFVFYKLNDWIISLENHLELAIIYHKFMSGVDLVSLEKLNLLKQGPVYKNLIVFMLEIPFKSSEKFIKELQIYLDTISKESKSSLQESMTEIENDITSKLIKRAKSFKIFYEANKNTTEFGENNAVFMMSEISSDYDNTEVIGGTIYLYRAGELINKDFIPPSPPTNVEIVNITTDSVLLEWLPPIEATEEILRYEISYNISSEFQNENVTVTEDIMPTTDNTTSFTLTLNLNETKPPEDYRYQVRAVVGTGVSAFSDDAKPLDNLAVCMPSCKNGKCLPPNICYCEEGWKGSQCQIPVCNPPCVNGQCSSPNTCSCRSGWEGDQCQTDNLIKPTSGLSYSWQDSIIRCLDMGAKPWVPRTPEDFEVIRNLNLGNWIWVPASDRVTEGQLKWWDLEDASSTPGILWGSTQYLYNNAASRDCLLCLPYCQMSTCNTGRLPMICVK